MVLFHSGLLVLDSQAFFFSLSSTMILTHACTRRNFILACICASYTRFTVPTQPPHSENVVSLAADLLGFSIRIRVLFIIDCFFFIDMRGGLSILVTNLMFLTRYSQFTHYIADLSVLCAHLGK